MKTFVFTVYFGASRFWSYLVHIELGLLCPDVFFLKLFWVPFPMVKSIQIFRRMRKRLYVWCVYSCASNFHLIKEKLYNRSFVVKIVWDAKLIVIFTKLTPNKALDAQKYTHHTYNHILVLGLSQPWWCEFKKDYVNKQFKKRFGCHILFSNMTMWQISRSYIYYERK